MFLIGADIGQAVDSTALGVIENTERPALRHLECLPSGISYPDIVSRIETLQTSLCDSLVILDNTGVGRPVADMLTDRGVPFVPGSITGGKTTRCVDGVWSVPKRNLMRGLCSALETGGLQIAQGLPFVDALQAEMNDFRVTLSDS